MENVIQQNIPPFQPTPVTPVPSSTNWSRIIIFVLIGLVLIVGSVFVGIQIGKSQITKQPPIVEQPTIFPTQAVINPTTILTNEPNPTIDPTSDWKTYNIKELNISFKLPEELVNLGKWETQILSGETGNNICFKLADKISFGVSSVMAGGIGICDNIKFRINSNSFDYSAGRGGVFGDIQGYKKIGSIDNLEFRIKNCFISSSDGFVKFQPRGEEEKICRQLPPIFLIRFKASEYPPEID